MTTRPAEPPEPTALALASPRLLPPDHPDRNTLAAEVHARPPEPLAAPSRASYVAVRVEPEARGAEHAHITALCQSLGVAPPPAHHTHWTGTLGALRFKWERHGEFSSYTVFCAGLAAQPFAEPAAQLLPTAWLADVPGLTVFACHAELAHAAPGAINANTNSPAGMPPRAAQAPDLATYFGPQPVVGAEIGDGAGLAFTDFVIQPDGFARFLMQDRDMTARQAGRMLQRLFEIEAYRMMALLALPLARALWPRLVQLETTLAALTARIAVVGRDIGKDVGAAPGKPGAAPAPHDAAHGALDNAQSDEALLQQLTALAAEIESTLAGSQARFGASRAYHALVNTRIGELRERRIDGLQTIAEFMARRLSPAMATCVTVQQRLHDLSERVAQASNLLSTRVDITRGRQNQALLEATARRARLQLRLQQTVEGLSVAAIVYYMAGLVGYGAKAFKAAGLPVSPDMVTGAAVPLLAVFAWWGLRRVHHRITQDDTPGAAPGGEPH